MFFFQGVFMSQKVLIYSPPPGYRKLNLSPPPPGPNSCLRSCLSSSSLIIEFPLVTYSLIPFIYIYPSNPSGVYMLTLNSEYNEYIKKIHSNQSHYFSFTINKGNEHFLHNLLLGFLYLWNLVS